MNILFAFWISMCDKSRITWLCVHWQWNTLEWCQLNALQASPVVHLVTPLSCVSLSMNTQPSVPTIDFSFTGIWMKSDLCENFENQSVRGPANYGPARRVAENKFLIITGESHPILNSQPHPVKAWLANIVQKLWERNIMWPCFLIDLLDDKKNIFIGEVMGTCSNMVTISVTYKQQQN